jgi:GMP synthase-like glutamine amidotransferase
VTPRLPSGAFDYYVSLGIERSHQGVADQFGVVVEMVSQCALRDNWKVQLADRLQLERKMFKAEAAKELEAVHERHLKTLRAIQAQALKALRENPISGPMDAVRALELAMRQEREIEDKKSKR